MPEDEKLSLVNIKGGAAIEIFDRALQKVIENIYDPNTTNDAREISLKVTLKPMDENRQIIAYSIKCPTKLSGQESVKGIADLKIEEGRLVAVGRREAQQSLGFVNVAQFTGAKKDQD